MANAHKTDGKQTVKGKFPPGNKIGRQFPKGTSGNKNGRPRLTRLTESLRRLIAETNPDAPEETIAETIAQTLVTLALAGDITAIKEIANRTEGLPKQAIDLDIQSIGWRDEAQKYGISEAEVAAEARLLLSEFDSANGDEAID
jgi:hypothetical protein